MKKSGKIKLVLITATLAACNQAPKDEWDNNNKIHLRSDTTAPYTRVHHYHGGGIGNALLLYYAFRPMGNFNNNRYDHSGYYSGAISTRSNIGNNTFKGSVSRGGFGRSGYSVGG